MAKNYSLIINSRFKPFTYAEIMAPIHKQTEAHQSLEDSYSEMAQKADVWKDMANKETDSEAYSMYKKYSDDLKARADDLARNGLNASSRASMLDMARRYSSEIKPIENAYNRRADDIKRQKDSYDKDNTMMWDRSASIESLDHYLHDNVPEYYKVSGKDLRDNAKAEAMQASLRYFRTEEGKRFNNDYLDFIEKTGYDSDQAMQILAHAVDNNGNPKYPEFEGIISRVAGASDYSKLSDDDKLKADKYIMEGISQGIGYNEKNTLHADWRRQENLRHAYDMETLRERYKYPSGSGKGSSGNETIGSMSLAEPIVFGNEGKKINQERFSGLVPMNDSNGYTTDKLSKLKKNADFYYRGMNAFTDEQKKKFLNYEAYLTERVSQAGKTFGTSGAAAMASAMQQGVSIPPDGYETYKSARDQYTKAMAKYNEERMFLDSVASKYSYLGENKYQAIERSLALEKAQSSKNHSVYPLLGGKTLNDHIQDDLEYLLNAYAKASFDSNVSGIMKVSNNGTLSNVTAGELKQLKGKPITMGVDSNNGIVASIDNTQYVINNFSPFVDANQRMSNMKSFLYDYTREGLSAEDEAVIHISNDRMKELRTGEILYDEDLDGSSPEPYMVDGKSTGYYKLIAKSGDDIAKILLSPAQGSLGYYVVGISTLNDEIEGGKLSATALRRMATAQLNRIGSTFGEK